MKSRLISASLVLVMLLTLLPAAVMAEGETTTPTITIQSKDVGYQAETVKVDVVISNNPGIVTMTIPVKWDTTVLTLTNVTVPKADTFGLTQLPGKANGQAIKCSGWIGADLTDEEVAAKVNADGIYYLAWDNDLAEANFTGNGTLCTLEFAVADGREIGDKTTITAEMGNVAGDDVLDIANVMNYDMEDRNADIGYVAGTLSFVEKTFVVGDVSGDLTINTIDAIMLLRYIAGGYDIQIDDIRIGDLNKDGVINTIDAIMLLRYIAGGYDIVLPQY